MSYETTYSTGSRTDIGYTDIEGDEAPITSDNVVNGSNVSYYDRSYSIDHHTPLSYVACMINSREGTETLQQNILDFRGGSSGFGYYCDLKHKHFGAQYVPYVPPFMSDTGISITIAGGYDYQNLINSALADLNSAKVDSAMILAELNKTSSYLAQTATTAVRVLLDIKHLRWSKALKRLGITKAGFKSMKTPASALLQYRYAIKPLLMDVHGAMEIARGSMTAELNRAYISGKSQDKVKSSDVSYVAYRGEWKHESELTHRVKVYAKITSPEMAAAKHLTSINPAVIAWELVPFSFVVDWFLPIGDLLKASTAYVGLEPAGWYTSVKVDTESTYLWDKPDDEDQFGLNCPTYVNRTGSAKGTARGFRRMAQLTSAPIVRMPHLEQGLSSNINIATALALLASLRK